MNKFLKKILASILLLTLLGNPICSTNLELIEMVNYEVMSGDDLPIAW